MGTDRAVSVGVYAELAEQDLLGLARYGDVGAFGELVERHGEMVYRRARSIVASHEDAQDLTQDVFLAAWRGLSTFREHASLATWLYTITTHRSLNALRRRTATPVAEIDGPDHSAGPLETVEARDDLEAVRAAVNALPEPQRTMTTLCADDATYLDIATTTGTTVAAVRSHLHRARRTLRAALRS